MCSIAICSRLFCCCWLYHHCFYVLGAAVTAAAAFVAVVIFCFRLYSCMMHFCSSLQYVHKWRCRRTPKRPRLSLLQRMLQFGWRYYIDNRTNAQIKRDTFFLHLIVNGRKWKSMAKNHILIYWFTFSRSRHFASCFVTWIGQLLGKWQLKSVCKQRCTWKT